MRVGIIGPGRIAPAYLRLAPLFEHFTFVAIAGRTRETAAAFGAAHGLEGLSIPELLARDDIDIVANFTPIAVHDETSRAILEAGKHLYSEKPLTASVSGGRALIELAAARGLSIAVAPDTMLGAGIRTARALIEAGRIGRVLGASGHFLEDGARFGANMYTGRIGPLRELGPYYLSALVTLAGPIASVAACAAIGLTPRTIRDGKTIVPTEAGFVQASLQFRSGAIGGLAVSTEVIGHRHTPLEVYGETGTLIVPDPNFFGGVLEIIERNGTERVALENLPFGAPNWPPEQPHLANYRGVGLAEMADALERGRPPRCSPEVALHVADAIESILEAGERYVSVALGTDTALPEPLRDSEAVALLRQDGTRHAH